VNACEASQFVLYTRLRLHLFVCDCLRLIAQIVHIKLQSIVEDGFTQDTLSAYSDGQGRKEIGNTAGVGS
jgi:hypothetical protein